MLKAIVIIVYRDLLRFWRMKLRSVATMVLPVVWLGLFGPSLAAAFQGAQVFGSVSYLTFLFPGALASNLVFSSIGSATSIVAEREFGFLKEVLVAPVSRLSIAIGKTVAGAVIATLSTLPMLLIGPVLGVPITPIVALLLMPVMFFVAASVSGFGVVIGSRLKSVESAQLVFQFLLFPLLFLSGSFAPISDIPPWLQVLTALNPVTYCVDLLRRVTFQALDISHEVIESLVASFHGKSLSIHIDIAILSLFALVTITAGVFAFARRD